MSATRPGASGAVLDQDTPDTIRLSVAEATALGQRALQSLGLPDDDVRIIIKATPRQPGVEAIRIPSERAFRERDRRRVEGLVLERKVVEALTALALA